MSGRYVLDTNVVVAVLNGEAEAVAWWQDADELLLPAPVLGELLYGARGGRRAAESERAVLQLVEVTRLVPCDRAVADHYADIKQDLRRRGRPIPENDIWIAAVCRHTSGVLASRDHHFDELPELQRNEWR